MTWGKWVPYSMTPHLFTRRRLLRYCVERLGVTEVDVRSMRIALNHELYQVRLWNGRRFTISGRVLFERLAFQ